MKQTATQWLATKLNDLLVDLTEERITPIKYAVAASKLVKKAKGMEREAMESSYREGFKRCHHIKHIEQTGEMGCEPEEFPDDFDTYYEKRYGK